MLRPLRQQPGTPIRSPAIPGSPVGSVLHVQSGGLLWGITVAVPEGARGPSTGTASQRRTPRASATGERTLEETLVWSTGWSDQLLRGQARSGAGSQAWSGARAHLQVGTEAPSQREGQEGQRGTEGQLLSVGGSWLEALGQL